MAKPDSKATFHLTTLGCSKNTADSEGVARQLARIGLRWTDRPEQAGVVLINTCGFIKDAKEESLNAIMGLVKLKKTATALKVVVFGCLVKRYRESIAAEIPEIDLLLDFLTEESIERIGNLFPEGENHCDSHAWGNFFTPKHIGILKIAEGCDNRCAYCAIPSIRGPFRSFPVDQLVEKARTMAIEGVRELSVVAQDTTRFGDELETLLQQISLIEELKWVRLHYLHPARVTTGLISRLFNIPKVVPYFDIPFQHVSDRILQLMGRNTSKAHLIELIGRIRAEFPESVIRTTLIVGFPTEMRQEFDELLEFIDEFPIDRLGAFPYSTEEKTPAARFRPKILRNEKMARLDELMTLQQVLAAFRNESMTGKTIDVMIDEVAKDHLKGRSSGDAYEVDNSIRLEYDDAVRPGEIVRAKITGVEAYDLYGAIVR